LGHPDALAELLLSEPASLPELGEPRPKPFERSLHEIGVVRGLDHVTALKS
jgi:hypothetical protein